MDNHELEKLSLYEQMVPIILKNNGIVFGSFVRNTIDKCSIGDIDVLVTSMSKMELIENLSRAMNVNFRLHPDQRSVYSDEFMNGLRLERFIGYYDADKIYDFDDDMNTDWYTLNIDVLVADIQEKEFPPEMFPTSIDFDINSLYIDSSQEIKTFLPELFTVDKIKENIKNRIAISHIFTMERENFRKTKLIVHGYTIM